MNEDGFAEWMSTAMKASALGSGLFIPQVVRL